jgi:acetyltransferase-like isoleucine patch superfamily enzyme
MKLKEICKYSKLSESKLIIFTLKRCLYKFKWKKDILAHDKVQIKNIRNISTKGLLKIGVDYFGFSSKYDATLLNINGKLNFAGDYSIGKGCRFDIGTDAKVEIGAGGHMSPNTNVIIAHGLKIGNDCAISWGCQFLDEDFHTFEYEGKKEHLDNSIVIGNNVWVGNYSFIYKGVRIPNGCVIASNSVVKSSFVEENVLIGGNPAQIIKRNIHWEK